MRDSKCLYFNLSIWPKKGLNDQNMITYISLYLLLEELESWYN